MGRRLDRALSGRLPRLVLAGAGLAMPTVGSAAHAQSQAPTRSLVSIDDVGKATAFLALDGAKLITGDVMYIDGGYHIID